MNWLLTTAALLLGVSGCVGSPSDQTSELPEKPRYEPFRAFYEIPCSDASDMILFDMTRGQGAMTPEDISPYIYAFSTRYEECQKDRSYVDDYLGLIQAAGWSGRYNRIFASFNASFPDQRNRSAMPDSAFVTATSAAAQ